MPTLHLVSAVTGATIQDWGPRLIAIPAGYAIGAWIGTLVAFVAGLNREARTDLRDLAGIIGGAGGLAVWFITSFLVN